MFEYFILVSLNFYKCMNTFVSISVSPYSNETLQVLVRRRYFTESRTDASIVPPFFDEKFVLKRGVGLYTGGGSGTKIFKPKYSKYHDYGPYKNKLIFTIVHRLKCMYLKKLLLLSSNCFIFADDHGISFAFRLKNT